jgi:hypothetical protein
MTANYDCQHHRLRFYPVLQLSSASVERFRAAFPCLSTSPRPLTSAPLLSTAAAATTVMPVMLAAVSVVGQQKQ